MAIRGATFLGGKCSSYFLTCCTKITINENDNYFGKYDPTFAAYERIENSYDE